VDSAGIISLGPTQTKFNPQGLNQPKKGETTMSYTKPEVVALGTSLEAIQGTKENCVHQDGSGFPSTAGAYLADE
jgi:hypothetical protein